VVLQLTSIALLKIDVEGDELQVLQGISSHHWGIIQSISMEVTLEEHERARQHHSYPPHRAAGSISAHHAAVGSHGTAPHTHDPDRMETAGTVVSKPKPSRLEQVSCDECFNTSGARDSLIQCAEDAMLCPAVLPTVSCFAS